MVSSEVGTEYNIFSRSMSVRTVFTFTFPISSRTQTAAAAAAAAASHPSTPPEISRRTRIKSCGFHSLHVVPNNLYSVPLRVVGLRMALAHQPNSAAPVVEQKKISLQNKHGEKLVGILHDTGSKELVILCHGFRSKKEHYIMVNLATGLEKENISAFRFDFSGNGESEGSFTYGHYFREADDLNSVVEHFTSLGYNVIAVVGHSKGGDVVLLYASKYHNVQKVVNLSGRYNLHEGIAERLGKDYLEQVHKDGFIDVKQNDEAIYRVTKESLMDRLETDMHKASLMIDKSCRVLTVHGSADEVIPVEDGKAFANIIPNHKLHIIEGADHCYSQHQSELVPVVVDFIKTSNPQD